MGAYRFLLRQVSSSLLSQSGTGLLPLFSLSDIELDLEQSIDIAIDLDLDLDVDADLNLDLEIDLDLDIGTF